MSADWPPELEQKAVELLTQREHGIRELRGKLAHRFSEVSPEALDALLQALVERGWLDEQRFAESAVNSYLARGDGPMKIRHKLADRFDEPWRLDEALALPDEVWVETAREALIKKFGSAEKPAAHKEVARRLRFLQGRGFTAQQCWAAFE